MNKHTTRQYGVHNAGDRVRVSEAWEGDRYYIQHGVNTRISMMSNPLLSVVGGDRALRLVLFVLRSLFTVDTASMWINGAGEAVTPCHYDSDHNLVFVMHGSCTFFTAPSDAFTSNIRENESTNSPRNSRFFTPHTVNAGQAAIQPAGMWHHVESSAHCVKVGIFFS